MKYEVNDFREWIKLLEDQGELRRIKAEVDWNEEIGAITRMVLSAHGPALLFENIKDYKDTYCKKILTAGFGNYNRVALALGLDKGTSTKELVKAYRAGLRKRIAPVTVDKSKAVCKQNILTGDDIDLYQLPVPKWHDWDGGRYIDTFNSTITRDPDTGVQNVGIYRGMIADKDKISKMLAVAQHWGQHYTKYGYNGKEMPVALVYGTEPLIPYLGMSPVLHNGFSELDIVGGIKGKPVEVVKCETSDILVPANAEIVIEGTISNDPATFMPEGPFAEHTGYYGGASSPKPTVHVKAITYRDDPILRGSMEGIRPGWPTENSFGWSVAASAAVWNHLEDSGISGITDVWMNGVSTYMTIFVQIRKAYRGQAKQIANAIWAMSSAYWSYKNVVVVEEDIDIHDYEQIDWAIAYRVNAGEGDIEFFHGTFGSLLDPSTGLEERDSLRYGAGKWTRVLVDATRNWEHSRIKQWNNSVYPPVIVQTKEVEEKTLARWDELGLGDIKYEPTMALDKDEDIKQRYSLHARPDGA